MELEGYVSTTQFMGRDDLTNNLLGKTAFFWGTLSLITTIWAYFRLPETKGRTFEELDILFLRGVNARAFADADMSEETDYATAD